jgi:hypothetical protein
MCFPRSY